MSLKLNQTASNSTRLSLELNKIVPQPQWDCPWNSKSGRVGGEVGVVKGCLPHITRVLIQDFSAAWHIFYRADNGQGVLTANYFVPVYLLSSSGHTWAEASIVVVVWGIQTALLSSSVKSPTIPTPTLLFSLSSTSQCNTPLPAPPPPPPTPRPCHQHRLLAYLSRHRSAEESLPPCLCLLFLLRLSHRHLGSPNLTEKPTQPFVSGRKLGVMGEAWRGWRWGEGGGRWGGGRVGTHHTVSLCIISVSEHVRFTLGALLAPQWWLQQVNTADFGTYLWPQQVIREHLCTC